MAAPDWLTERPIAHRGLHDVANGIVENSAAAMQAAVDAGYAIEIDLQITGDGRAIVFHDETLDRLTGESGAVRDRPAAELEEIPLLGSENTILGVQDCLDIVAGAVPIVIELKSLFNGNRRLAEFAAEMVDNYAGAVAFQSFDPDLVGAIRVRAPLRPCGLVSYGYRDPRTRARVGRLQRFMLRHMLTGITARPDFITYDSRALPAPAPRMARQIFGRPVLAWTVRSETEAARVAPHADQIIFEDFLPILNG